MFFGETKKNTHKHTFAIYICEVSGFLTLDCWRKRVNIIEQKVQNVFTCLVLALVQNKGKTVIFFSVWKRETLSIIYPQTNTIHYPDVSNHINYVQLYGE